jgi:hypothetical protein
VIVEPTLRCTNCGQRRAATLLRLSLCLVCAGLLREELALERIALVEHEQRATSLWRARRYEAARAEQRAADEARAYVDELEQRGQS